jgi:hypothetical protein
MRTNLAQVGASIVRGAVCAHTTYVRHPGADQGASISRGV